MNALFDYGAKIDSEHQNAKDPLKQALVSKNIDCLEILLSRGFKPSNKDGELSPLMQAIQAGLNDAIVPLLNHGVDINYVNQKGNCALNLAIRTNDESLVKLLLDRGADAKFKGLSGSNAVHSACAKGNLNILKMVIEAGADPYVNNDRGQNAAFDALLCPPEKMLEIFKYLYDTLDFDVNFECKGDTILTELLPDSNHFTPEVAEFLLSRGADIQKMTRTGKTIMDLAFSFGVSPEIKNLFIKRSQEDLKNEKK